MSANEFDKIDSSEVIPDDQVVVSQPDLGVEIPDDQVVLDEDKYGTDEQMAITALEGAAHGVAGPLATLAETKILGVPEEDILARQRENPLVHGAAQGVGLLGSAVAGTGMGALMGKAGEAAAALSGLGKTTEAARALAGAETALKAATKAGDAAKIAEASAAVNAAQFVQKEIPYAYRVGSEAVKQATEMAIFSADNEASKMLLNDPETSADTAIAEVGLNMAMGGAGGAFFAGAVSPLWHATVGPGVTKSLETLSSHLGGGPRVQTPEAVAAAMDTLQTEMSPVMRAVTSGDKSAKEMFNTLRYAQKQSVIDELEKFNKDISNSVMDSLGIDLESAKVHSKAKAGENVDAIFREEHLEKYGPIEAAANRRAEEAAIIGVSDDARLEAFDRILDAGIKSAKDLTSDEYKLYEKWAEKLTHEETIGGIDALRTRIGNDIGFAQRQGDTNTVHTLRSIRDMVGDFQETQIAKMGRETEKFGIEGAEREAASLINERAEFNRSYREYAKMSNEMMDHLSVGRFKGTETMLNKISSIGPETLLKKFSPKENAQIIPFLEQHYPKTAEMIRKNELLDLIQPAINSAAKKGEVPVDVNKLAEIIGKKQAGKTELVNFALSPEALKKIEAAQTLLNSVPGIKDSGTPGGLMKLLSKAPASIMATLSAIAGHNPLGGAIIGEMAHKLGRDVPDAIRFGYLKFLGSDQPVNAAGFKAMVDYASAVMKGDSNLNKGVKAVFQAGSRATLEALGPKVNRDNEKLDKAVTALDKAPEALLNRPPASNVGHYMEQQQVALTAASIRALAYLQTLKPQPHTFGPLDKPLPPTKMEVERYERALTIANRPLHLLERIKDGTIIPSDLADLNGMYPALYKQMSQKISTEMLTAHNKGVEIPYETRMGVSIFLGTPADASMTPEAIQASQLSQQVKGQPPMQPQGGSKPPKGSPSKVNQKTAKSYMTQSQSAEADRELRD